MSAPRLTRRQFVHDTAAGAAALAAGVALPNIVRVGNAEEVDTREHPELQPGHGVPPLRQDRLDGLGRVPGRPLETGQPDGAGRVPGRQLAERQPERRRLPEEPLRRGHPLHRAGHQLHRRLHRGRDPGVQQGPGRPPRQDVPGLVLVRTRGPQPQPVHRRRADGRVRGFAAGVQTGVRRPVPHRLRRRRPPRQGRQVDLSRTPKPSRRASPKACGGRRSRARPGPPASRRTTCRGSST